MKIQSDSNVIRHLLAQLPPRAGLSAADFAVNAAPDGVRVSEGEEELAVLPVPFKAGRLLNLLMRAAARPMTDLMPESIPLGPYLFRPRLATLSRAGADIVLTNKERDILATLWLAPGHALDRDALLEKVWAYAEGVETHTLETHIYRLRQKIEADPADPKLLVNDDGRYRLEH